MRLKWLVVLAPLTAGLALDVLLARLLAALPILYLRADLGTLAFLAGVALSIATAAYLTLSDQADKARQRAFTQAADDRRRFLRRLDHELKNPLTAIRAGVVNLTEAPTKEAGHEALETVEAQALRLSRLAADLRKLAELETRPLEYTSVDIASLLEEAFTLAQDNPGAEARRLTLSIPKAPWPLPVIAGDPDLLFLAVHNLLDNAIKFTRPGDTVEVRAFEDGATVAIEIADTGPGIPEKDMPHVWEELYRGESARGVPGSGLGLPLIRAIAERHKGQVSLRSRKNQGTVFTIKLPVGNPPSGGR